MKIHPVLIPFFIVIVLFISAASYYFGTMSSTVTTQVESKPVPEATDMTELSEDEEIDLSTIPVPESAQYDISRNWKEEGFLQSESRYFSFWYPESWYNWSWGRGISLFYEQINSVPSTADELATPTASFMVDVQTLDYTDGRSLEDRESYLRGLQQQFPTERIAYTREKFVGVDAIVSERSDVTLSSTDQYPRVGYTREIWLLHNNRKYIIVYNLWGKDLADRERMMQRYEKDYKDILSSFELL